MSIIGRMRRVCVFLLIIVAFGSRDTRAQNSASDPHVAYSYPAGCRQGTSCQVLVGGQFLRNVNDVHVAGSGVDVEIVVGPSEVRGHALEARVSTRNGLGERDVRVYCRRELSPHKIPSRVVVRHEG